MTRRRVTLAEVKASINSNVPAHFTVRWFGRPLGDLMTPAFSAAGFNANQVTTLRALIAFGGLGLFLVPGFVWGPVCAAMVFYFCFILDCVDGNIARLQNDASYWGKFMDGIADFIFVQGAPLAAGVWAWQYDGSAEYLLLGALVTVTTLASQMLRARLSFMREWMVSLSGPIDPAVEEKVRTARKVQAFIGETYVNGTFFAPLILIATPLFGVQPYLIALALVQFLPELIWIGATLSEASHLLARHRRSKHAQPLTD